MKLKYGIVILIIIILLIVVKINYKENKIEESNSDMRVFIKINDETLTLSLENNSSVDALIEKLKISDIELDMHDYNNMEKVGELEFSLPRNDKSINVDYGDVILYLGNNIAIYYDKNSWNFTKLGKIENIEKDELKNILGEYNIKAILTLKEN